MISIIITAFDRPEKLKQTLLGFQKQNINQELIDYEVIVADNHPDAKNKIVVDCLNKGMKRKIRYIHQPVKGKCYALNAAVNKACYDILSFTDEDNIPDDNYLINIIQSLGNKDVHVVTGRILLYNSEDAPLTIIADNQKKIFAWPCSPWKVGHGSNLSFKKNILHEIGYYDIGFGPGTFIGSGEDTDLIYRILKKGYKIHYQPEILNYHNHGRSNKNDADIIRLNYAKGRGGFYTKHILKGDTFALRLYYWEFLELSNQLFITSKSLSHQETKSNAILALKGLLYGSLSRILTNFLSFLKPQSKQCPR